jgi:hypothetical protein
MTITVRMYRQGFGDCFLITFPRKDGSPYRVMIDCGVIQGQPKGTQAIRDVAQDVAVVSGHHIDLLIATHEHWDHISGFGDALDILRGIDFDEVWLGWTENPHDAQATALVEQHTSGVRAIRLAETRLRLAGDLRTAGQINDFSELLGVVGDKTHTAWLAIPGLAAKVRYCDPTDGPIEIGDTGILAYALGPPRDHKLLHTLSLGEGSGEMYGLTAESLEPNDSVMPFDPIYCIPTERAKAVPFFANRYFGGAVIASNDAPAWRQIDTAFLEDAAQLALQIDSYTNNTSLVVAFELPTSKKDVMLFPGDAQIGSWLSWKDLKWEVDGKTVTGPDLLARTHFYKAGHHGSHNATAKESGLEVMTQLKFAMIPVDHAEAVRKRWTRIPLRAIVDALSEATDQHVIQADEDAPEVTRADSTALYHEVAMTFEDAI